MLSDFCGHKPRRRELCVKRPVINVIIGGSRSRWLVGVVILLILGAASQGTAAPPATESPKSPQVTVLHGTITHAPSKGVTLILKKDRQATVAGDDGSFSFSVQLREPAYAELEFDFQRH